MVLHGEEIIAADSMKYLRYSEARETLIDKKIIFLEDIAADMRDAGMDVKIFNGSDSSLFGTLRMHLASGKSIGSTSKYIYVVVMKSCNRANGLEGPQETPEFKEFFERLKESGIGYRFMAGGETYAVPGAEGFGVNASASPTGYVVVGIDKRSRLSRQEIQNLI